MNSLKRKYIIQKDEERKTNNDYIDTNDTNMCNETKKRRIR